MTSVEDAALVLARQALTLAPVPTGAAVAASTSPPACDPGNNYDGRLNLRISAIFVILVGSTIGMDDQGYDGASRD